MKKILTILIAFVMSLSLVSCGGNTPDSSSDSAVVNIGCTSSVGTLNPILVGSAWSDYYAMSMQYLPLVALDENAEFEYMLADSITTEDNLRYTIHINEDAVWSDGTPITAEDVVFTINRLASPVIANPAMMLHALVGTDDATGYLPQGVDSVAGVQAVDEKTVEITFKYELNMISFLNGYAQYILTLPKHVLENVPVAEFASYEWFAHPDVVSGPYMATSFNSDHYVTYTAKDKSGNTATYRRKVTVLPDHEDTDALVAYHAARCGNSIVEITNYVRSYISYNTNWGGSDPVWYGFTNRVGNCYVHALCLQRLLSYHGYSTQLIWVTNESHYWVIVETDEGWRHIDSTPSYQHERIGLATDEIRFQNLNGRDWDRSQWPACE